MKRVLVLCLLVGAVSAQDADAERLKLTRLAIEAKLKVGDVYREQGKLPEALKAYQEAIALFDALGPFAPIGVRGIARPGAKARVRDVAVVQGDPQRHEDANISRVDTEKSIKRALQWLSTHQSRDGRWDADDWMRHDPENNKGRGTGGAHYDVGVTGLALTAFLRTGHGDKNNPFADNVARGLRFLMDQQDAEGCFGARASQHYIYNSILATAALCDGYRVTKNPAYRRAAQTGLNWLARARNPYLGWRYGVREGENDTSVTSLATQAMAAGRLAGLKVDPDNFTGALAWVDKMTDPDFGQVGYNSPGGSVARPEGLQDKFPPQRSQAMTAAGILIRIYAGEDPRRSQAMQKGAVIIARQQPAWDHRGYIDMYFWYLGTKALFEVGGEHWRDWPVNLRNNVVTGQSKDGSWSPVGPWGNDGGRIYSTAICALALHETMRPLGERIFAVRK